MHCCRYDLFAFFKVRPCCTDMTEFLPGLVYSDRDGSLVRMKNQLVEDTTDAEDILML